MRQLVPQVIQVILIKHAPLVSCAYVIRNAVFEQFPESHRADRAMDMIIALKPVAHHAAGRSDTANLDALAPPNVQVVGRRDGRPPHLAFLGEPDLACDVPLSASPQRSARSLSAYLVV
jgi:hypothetical protein